MKGALLTIALALSSFATAQEVEDETEYGEVYGKKPPKPKTPVTSEALQKDVKLDDLLAGSKKLQSFADKFDGHRAFGSAAHNATVDWIYEELKSTGYFDVVKQPFTEVYSQGTASLTYNGAKLESNIMTYTPAVDVTGGQVAAVNNLGCEIGDYPAEVSGKVALISRGTCNFAAKSLLAKQAGAVAALIYNNVPGSISGTLGEPYKEYAPVVSITQADGQTLLAALGSGAVTVDLKIDATTEDRTNYNVLAETKQGDHKNVLVVGGHSDSVFAGPGINDDGSGIIGILTVAKALAKYKFKNAVRFGFWGAEEYGLLGSYYYMNSINGSDHELSKIRAYLNFDMIASPNYVYAIYDGDGSAFNLTGPAGSDVLERDFEQFFAKKGKPSIPTEFSGRSDYAAFIENGIPSGGLFTGAENLKTEEEAKLFGGEAGVAYDINYHKKGDDINNLNHDAYLLNTKAIADSVAKYALSFKSLPKVNLNTRRWAADRARFVKREGSLGHDHRHSGPCGTVDA